nr:hypothetical protein [Propionibacterium sp.]
MTDHDYWGATGADLPRVRLTDDAGDGAGAPTVAAAGPGTATDPLFRATVRLPRVSPVEPPPLPAEPAASEPTMPAALDVPSGGPTTQQHRRLALVLGLAVAAVGGLVGWRLLAHEAAPRAIPAPVPTVATPAPTPAPPPTLATTRRTPVPVVETSVGYGPPPPPQYSPVPVRTITHTVLVSVPAPHEATATPTPSPTASSPATPTPTTPLPTIPTAGWRFDPTGVGPITLGMPVAVAAQEGFLVPDAAAAEGFVTSPALQGVRLWLADGLVIGVVVTDPGIRSAEGLGVGTPLADLERLFGDALVMVTLRDTAGQTSPLPGLEYPTSFLAFVPAAEPTPTASGSPSPTPPVGGTPVSPADPTPTDPTPTDPTPTDPTPTAPTPTAPTASGPTPSPTPTGTVQAVIVALKQPAPTPSTPPGSPSPPTATAP